MTDAISAKSAALARQDSLAVSVTDSKAVTYAIARGDTPTVSLGESNLVQQFKARSDSLTIGVTEARQLAATLSLADSTVVSAAESIQIAVALMRQDALPIGAVESRELNEGQVRVECYDDLGLSLLEMGNVGRLPSVDQVGHLEIADQLHGTLLIDDFRRDSVEPPLSGATLEVRDGQLL